MSFEVSYLVALLAGLISFLSPCVFPLVPPYLCYLGGTSLDQLAKSKDVEPGISRRVFLASLIFVFGFSTVFIALGASASVLGGFISQHIDTLAMIGGVIIIIFGLHFLGLFKIGFLMREVRYQGQISQVGYFGAYMMGLAFAAGWTPCVGPILSPILMIAGSKETVMQGVVLLTIYSMGLGIPFILASLFVSPFLAFMQRFRKHLGLVEKLMGALLVLTGILFLTGSMTMIAGWALETLPDLEGMVSKFFNLHVQMK
jgi:cytochrome c-type biogenesis protein